MKQTVIDTNSPDKLTASEREVLVAKARRDPIYGSAYAIAGSVEQLVEGGFFDDGASEEAAATRAQDDWLMTPTFKITERLSNIGSVLEHQRLIVLLSTGSFCPIHDGHVEQLNIAKYLLEEQGHIVLGGYMSPSHDSYVNAKCGGDTLSAVHRLRLCEEAAAESDWLMGDGWEALGTERPLNFTDVIVRLERYLAKHIASPKPIEVVYVFGSDHARFSLAFIGKGSCVCTLRPGYEDNFYKYASAPGIRDNPRIVFAPGQKRVLSSSAVRQGGDGLMVERARKVYLGWRKQQQEPTEKAPEGLYLLRDEGRWAYGHWMTHFERQELPALWQTYQVQLMALLQAVHAKAESPDSKREVKFRVVSICNQLATSQQIADKHRVISLDPCIPGDFNLGVCREFPLTAACESPVITNRPGTEPLPLQIGQIPAGDWVLLDDDISTGRTMATIAKMITSSGDCKVIRCCALTDRRQNEDIPLVDILDFRDFLAGSRQGGLVVTLPNGERARAPYCLPYVSPSDRASIPISSEYKLSQELWRINATFFKSVDEPITLGETDPDFRKLMHYVGFTDDNTRMETIAEWHLRCLERLIAAPAKTAAE